MSLDSFPALAINALFYALLFGAGLSDLLRFRIPNAIVLAIAVLFLPAALVASGEVNWLGHLGAGVTVLVCAAFMFHFNLMGGGDAKMLAAVAFWTGFATLLPFLVVVSVIGGVLALVLLVARFVCKRVPLVDWPRLLLPGNPMPYGIAIGGGAAVARLLFPAF
jgi:prepilin peptidase CpaA